MIQAYSAAASSELDEINGGDAEPLMTLKFFGFWLGKVPGQTVSRTFFPKLCKVVPVAHFLLRHHIRDSDAQKQGSGHSILRAEGGI
jgi:hypothetical protein